MSSDFINDFQAFAEGIPGPQVFKLWSGIALVAGALERRVWVRSGSKIVTYPNLYVFLVAPPGIGKQIIETVRHFWTHATELGSVVPSLRVAPDNMTSASLIDELVKAKSTRMPPSGAPLTYHSLLVPAEEIGVMLPAYDTAYVGKLNSLWQNPSLHAESRRTGPVREVKIENPQLNILAGAQPAWLANTFPEDVWNTGIARRLLMIYAGEAPIQDIFQFYEDDEPLMASLQQRVNTMSQLLGALPWTDEALNMVREWNLAGGPPAPTHSKLVHYLRSRTQMLIKLCACASVSRTSAIDAIRRVDAERALQWLLDAEQIMPDIFRAMLGRSDKQVIDEMHLQVWTLQMRNGNKAIDGALIRQFLLERVPHDKVESLLLAAEKANILARVAGTMDSYVARPKTTLGVE